jgi:hypothetical protein
MMIMLIMKVEVIFEPELARKVKLCTIFLIQKVAVPRNSDEKRDL